MNKNIYIIRHCEAKGQSADSPLTEKGFTQANELANFLFDFKIDRIISSPFLRAIQTIKPFAENKYLEIELDNRLSERVLGSNSFPDWLDKLKATYDNMDLKYEGGESSNEAKKRIVEAIHDITASNSENTIIVAHGGIISLLLNHYNQNFGFEQWKGLNNPDVYLLSNPLKTAKVKRLWKER